MNPNLGTFQLGDEIPLQLQCYNATYTPASPDSAPTVRFYKDATATADVSGVLIESQDLRTVTGLFCGKIILDGRFSTGQWTAVFSWGVSAFSGKELKFFEIVSGGDPRGEIISMTWFDRRAFASLVWQTNSGNIISGRNPRV